MEWLRRLLGGKDSTTSLDVVDFYRDLGFFSETDPGAVLERYERDHGEPPDFKSRWDDVHLLAYDRGLVWAGDPKADVDAHSEVYAQVLPQWAAVSRGAFEPTGVTEDWEGERGPITVRFRLKRKEAKLTPRYLGDRIDMEILKQINRVLGGRDRRFECAVDADFALVVCLTPVEKHLLQTRRRFPFAW